MSKINQPKPSYVTAKNLNRNSMQISTPKTGSSTISNADCFLTKNTAITLLFQAIQKQLALLLNTFVCQDQKADAIETPHNIFSWSLEDFYMRRDIKNTAWIEVFLKQLATSECMETRKLQIDVKELMKYVKLIYKMYKGELQNVGTILESAYEFLRLFETIESDYLKNSKKQNKLAQDYHARKLKTDETAEQKDKLKQLEYELNESDVNNSIELRYQLRYCNANVEDYKDQKLVEEKAIQKQIDDLKEKIHKDSICSQFTVDALRTEIIRYKDQIEYMSNRYEKEFDEIVNKNTYKRINLDKLRTHRMFLEEEMMRFREEIAAVKQAEVEEAERLRLEWEKQQQEEAAKLLAKSKKKRKSRQKGKKNK